MERLTPDETKKYYEEADDIIQHTLDKSIWLDILERPDMYIFINTKPTNKNHIEARISKHHTSDKNIFDRIDRMKIPKHNLSIIKINGKEVNAPEMMY